MLRSRKRTCRRSKSRCGGRRQYREFLTGGGLPIQGSDAFQLSQGVAAQGVAAPTGGSRRGSRRGVRRSRSGGRRLDYYGGFGVGGSRVRRSRRGGAVGRTGVDLNGAGSLRGGGFPDRIQRFSKGGSRGGEVVIKPWAHEHGTIGFSKGGSRGGEWFPNEMLLASSVGGGVGGGFPYQIYPASSVGGRGDMGLTGFPVGI